METQRKKKVVEKKKGSAKETYTKTVLGGYAPFGIFANEEVGTLLIEYLHEIFPETRDSLVPAIRNFEDRFASWDQTSMRLAIVFSIRVTLKEKVDRYEDDDLLGWTSPYPIGDIGELCAWCSKKLLESPYRTKSWDLSERTLHEFQRVLFARIMANSTGSDFWKFAIDVKHKYQLKVGVKVIVDFITRRNSEKIRSEKLLLQQLSQHFGFQIRTDT